MAWYLSRCGDQGQQLSFSIYELYHSSVTPYRTSSGQNVLAINIIAREYQVKSFNELFTDVAA